MTPESSTSQPPDLDRPLWTVADLRRVLRCSRRSAYRAAHQIGPVRLGRAIRLDPETVRAWIRSGS